MIPPSFPDRYNIYRIRLPTCLTQTTPTTPIPHPSQAQAGPRSQNPRPSESGQQSTRGGRGSTNSSQKRAGGRAPGSQGYSQANCKALNHCVRQILPLGSQEWLKVQALYNHWAIANNRLECEADPLKTNFRTMVNARKPTGKTVCPPWICEAKEIEVLIRE
ncbi:hypothetical protein PGT21_004051 [Puccinia graminis f. sp. tritici]|uniref:DUF6818 domain-containing protein n=1 Tax=Puccinia graminis f. sp. tritici TaxID=56615 RepID=A0A5B0R4R9_PUCGR|nr:hypothetical protein PGT21_004051 [Puccinia graminis f. sp. tritici]KAA1120389.1 hypothetical protein PGTUg99_009698 [Puccinia graminis f. sp. tritici]